MSRVIGDPTFGIGAQALAILAMLSQTSCDDLAAYDEPTRDYKIEIKTHAWHNGREHGVCLEVRPKFGCRKALLVTFGEHRSSDNIFVDAWRVEDHFFNPPTVADYTDEAYKARTFIPVGQVGDAERLIRDKIQEFMTAVLAETAETLATPMTVTVHGRTATLVGRRRAASVLPDLGD